MLFAAFWSLKVEDWSSGRQFDLIYRHGVGKICEERSHNSAIIFAIDIWKSNSVFWGVQCVVYSSRFVPKLV